MTMTPKARVARIAKAVEQLQSRNAKRRRRAQKHIRDGDAVPADFALVYPTMIAKLEQRLQTVTSDQVAAWIERPDRAYYHHETWACARAVLENPNNPALV